jgi:hypothetical protein
MQRGLFHLSARTHDWSGRRLVSSSTRPRWRLNLPQQSNAHSRLTFRLRNPSSFALAKLPPVRVAIGAELTRLARGMMILVRREWLPSSRWMDAKESLPLVRPSVGPLDGHSTRLCKTFHS